VIHRLRVVHWLGVVHRLRVVGGLLMDHGSVGMVVSRVGHISNIARVGIGNGVLDSLEATVGKLDMVFTIGGVTITGLALAKLDILVIGVLGINAIGIIVLGRSRLISGLMIRLGVIGWCRVGLNRGVNWGVNGGVNGVRGTVIGDGNGHEGKEGNKNLKPDNRACVNILNFLIHPRVQSFFTFIIMYVR
jgi:hypothetical protein